jgi:hypothetical protein
MIALLISFYFKIRYSTHDLYIRPLIHAIPYFSVSGAYKETKREWEKGKDRSP